MRNLLYYKAVRLHLPARFWLPVNHCTRNSNGLLVLTARLLMMDTAFIKQVPLLNMKL